MNVLRVLRNSVEASPSTFRSIDCLPPAIPCRVWEIRTEDREARGLRRRNSICRYCKLGKENCSITDRPIPRCVHIAQPPPNKHRDRRPQFVWQSHTNQLRQWLTEATYIQKDHSGCCVGLWLGEGGGKSKSRFLWGRTKGISKKDRSLTGMEYQQWKW